MGLDDPLYLSAVALIFGAWLGKSVKAYFNWFKRKMNLKVLHISLHAFISSMVCLIFETTVDILGAIQL